MGTELRRRVPPADGATSIGATQDEKSVVVLTKSVPFSKGKCVKTSSAILNRIPVILFYSFWFLFGILVLRKTQNAIAAVRYVKSHGESVSQRLIEQSREFDDLIRMLDEEFTKPPAFLLLNQYALNMSYNFLCNTGSLPGVHERLIFVTLDTVARDQLKKDWPQIRQFHWPTPSLYSFWMMQQDTFWRKNLFDLGFEDDMSFDALFDQIGVDENSMRAEWVNGANFFIRANNDTLMFFERLSDKLAHWYTPDMGFLFNSKFYLFNFKIAHSWEWMYTAQKNPPYIMQLDCETDGGSKLMQLGKFGFHFVDSNGTCDYEKIRNVIKERSRRMNKRSVKNLAKTVFAYFLSETIKQDKFPYVCYSNGHVINPILNFQLYSVIKQSLISVINYYIVLY
uniref:Nucleotid_trans domain-containing protein n=1 Tax=Heterorhabditis bacteriophora TaxID=37862 RepID=A0A1I7XEF7_HETBA